ncbi:CBS domain-containing protein [Actinomadura miaoliensis]|uniref:CBS domain-containing protein n=1 Tax=Actinomadura miaoliensis TaxID=430685 RepID=A0ABP7VY97_9ACTN
MRRRKAEVMAATVVTVAEDMAFIEIVETMAEHNIHALPLADQDGRVTGIVSDADLPRKQEDKNAASPQKLPETLRHCGTQAKASAVDTCGLMTSSAVTLPRDASAHTLLYYKHATIPSPTAGCDTNADAGRRAARRRGRDPYRGDLLHRRPGLQAEETREPRFP